MKRACLLLTLGLLATLALGAQSFVRIITPTTDEVGVTNINEPILIEGECSSDVISVDIQFRFTPDSDGRGAGAKELELVETYRLQKFVSGSGRFLYRIFPSLGNLGCGTNEYTVVATTRTGTMVRDKVTVFSSFYFGEKAKPVIYLYPTRETEVRVNVRPAAGVSISIPEIGSGWRVRAFPDGRIVNSADGKTYPYLFWESPDESLPFTYKEGFVVSRDKVIDHFRETLGTLGLNPQEIDDFVDYWSSALAPYPWYHFYYLPQEAIDRAAPLDIVPRPDTVIRVYFDYRGLEAWEDIPPQRLSTPLRWGFTAVEWGGRRYKD